MSDIASQIDYTRHPALGAVARFAPPSAKIAGLAAFIDQLLPAAADPGFALDQRFSDRLDREFRVATSSLSESTHDSQGDRTRFVEALMNYVKQLLLQDLMTPYSRSSFLPRHANADVSQITGKLFESGFCFVALSEQDVAQLRKVVEQETVRLTALYEVQGTSSRAQLSRNQWQPEELAAFAAVFGKPDILAALTQYMAREVYFDGLAYEISVPGNERWLRYANGEDNARTLYYHCDRTAHAPKGIFYLSDVDADSGPTHLNRLAYSDSPFQRIVARAMDSSSLQRIATGVRHSGHMLASDAGRAIFASLPPELRRFGHFGNDVPKNSDVETWILDHEESMLGGPGTGVLFDGARVPHRGGIVTTGRRFAFQVIYRCKGALNDSE